MSALYDFPELPGEDVLLSLEQSCSMLFRTHPIINTLPLPSQSQQLVAPHLKLALACLGCTTSGGNPPVQYPQVLSRKLFLAGNILWAVMLEVDNSEARTLESVLSVSTVMSISTPCRRTFSNQCRTYIRSFYPCTGF